MHRDAHRMAEEVRWSEEMRGRAFVVRLRLSRISFKTFKEKMMKLACDSVSGVTYAIGTSKSGGEECVLRLRN